MLKLEVIEEGALRHHIFEKRSERWDVPLAIAEFVNEAILRLLNVSGTREATVTEDEVKLLVAEGARTGIFAPEEREMIDGVLRLADRSVRAVMTRS